MKYRGLTPGLHLKLSFLSEVEAGGIPSVAVKCVDIRRLSLIHILLAGNLLRAAADTGAHTIVLAGGVSANSGLRRRMEADCARLGYLSLIHI